MMMPSHIDNEMIQNMLIGIAIGDAFGAGVEFQDRNWIAQNVDFRHFVNARTAIAVPAEQLPAFTENYCAGDYTDDTEMTIALIHALLYAEQFGEDLLVAEIKAEYDRGIAQKGYGRNGHGSLRWYFEGEKSIAEIRDFQRFRPNPGNAPAVRAVPLGLLPSSMINRFAKINANATHPNIAAILASQCIARASEFMLVKKGDPSQIIPYISDNVALNEEYNSYLKQVDNLPQFDALTAQDFIALCGPQPIEQPYFLPGICGVPSDSKYTTGCALYVLKHSKDAFEALKTSILIGGDVDSVASITTGILAARHGLKSIPTFIQQNTEGLPYLQTTAAKFTSFLQSQ